MLEALERNKKPTAEAKVVITPPKMATAAVRIIGTAPYLQNRFSAENRDKMLETQKAGSAAKRTRKAKAPKARRSTAEHRHHQHSKAGLASHGSAHAPRGIAQQSRQSTEDKFNDRRQSRKIQTPNGNVSGIYGCPRRRID